MLTNERVELLGKFLTDDKERAIKLVAMAPEEAVAQINAAGYDFTVAEIEEFGKNLKKFAGQQGELNEEDLNDVSGGIVISATAAGVYLNCVVLGIGLGAAAANNWKW